MKVAVLTASGLVLAFCVLFIIALLRTAHREEQEFIQTWHKPRSWDKDDYY